VASSTGRAVLELVSSAAPTLSAGDVEHHRDEAGHRAAVPGEQPLAVAHELQPEAVAR
jgi:hypothetical protein